MAIVSKYRKGACMAKILPLLMLFMCIGMLYPFGRTFNLRDYSGAEDLQKVYNVELTIIPITTEIAKIESLGLVPKHDFIDWKGGKR